jgi:hypothetical protein
MAASTSRQPVAPQQQQGVGVNNKKQPQQQSRKGSVSSSSGVVGGEGASLDPSESADIVVVAKPTSPSCSAPVQ